MRDLSNYETVKERKKRFYSDNPDGRIIVEIQNNDILEYALFKATVFKNIEEQEKRMPWANGYALEIRDKELSVSNKGQEYASVNYSSWTENCEESAIGRALDNAGYSGNNKCSREEMQKAERHGNSKNNFDEIKEQLSKMGVDEMMAYWHELEPNFSSDKQKKAVSMIFASAKKERESA